LKITIIYKENSAIPKDISLKFCCVEMYLSSSVHHHICLPGRSNELAKLNNVYIGYCPYCGEKIETIREDLNETEAISGNKNIGDIQGCGRECLDEDTESLQRQRSENNSECNSIDSEQTGTGEGTTDIES